MREKLERAGGFISIGGIAVMSFLYFASGLVAPLWAVIVLILIWFVHLVLGCLWFTKHPIRSLVLPLSLVVIWFGAMLGGEELFGWTA